MHLMLIDLLSNNNPSYKYFSKIITDILEMDGTGM